eukprot:12908940-Prorocentrum_lima.AAC.1
MYYTYKLTGEVIELASGEAMPGMDDVEGSQELDDKYSTKIFKDTVGQVHICQSTGLHTQFLEVWLAQHTDLHPQI